MAGNHLLWYGVEVKKIKKWTGFLKKDILEWLLEEGNSAVRYYTLTKLLDEHEGSPKVFQSKKNIMRQNPVVKILSRQHQEGFWGEKDKFYTEKYKGTVWQLIILAELGTDKKDERIKKTCEFIFHHSQDKESGGFSIWPSLKTGGGSHSGVIPCLHGNMVFSLIRFGYLEDNRMQKAIDWIIRYQRFDDGIDKKLVGWPYDKAEPCWGKHTCHMGIIKSLKALSEIPPKKRNKAINETIQMGVEYILKHYIFKKSHNLEKVSKPGWLRFGFPLMYQTDILEILIILINLGIKDYRMQEAVDVVISQQNDQGKWVLKSTFNGRFITNIEQKGKPSKWITLRALRILKNWYES